MSYVHLDAFWWFLTFYRGIKGTVYESKIKLDEFELGNLQEIGLFMVENLKNKKLRWFWWQSYPGGLMLMTIFICKWNEIVTKMKIFSTAVTNIDVV